MTRNQLNHVLLRCYTHEVAVQSNYARKNAQEVAALASMNMITTKVVRGAYPVFGRTWRVTVNGLRLLSEEGIV